MFIKFGTIAPPYLGLVGTPKFLLHTSILKLNASFYLLYLTERRGGNDREYSEKSMKIRQIQFCGKTNILFQVKGK